ncbi:MAG: hypothetical protein K6G89_06670 [Clostridia bacterium]|nr:hypothetical protein [Clostridia bacterium]
MKKRIVCIVTILLFLLLFSACGHTHEFIEWTTVEDPTCVKDGLRESVCECGEIEQEIIPALGHTIVVDEAVPATCTQTGLTEGTHCSVCGETIVKQEITNKIDHTIEVLPAKEADCTNAGLCEGKFCSVCGEVIVEQTKSDDPLGHNFGESTVVKNADCENDGEADSFCQRCGEKHIEVIPALGHSWIDATCTSKKTCSVCGKTEGNFADHNYAKKTTESTCTKKGKTVYTCTACGHSYEEEIKLKEHSWKNATCTTPKTCSVCGKTEGSALGHTTDDGVCTRCNQTIISPYRQAINEENEYYQKVVNTLRNYESQLQTRIDLFNDSCRRLGIYSLQSESYYNSRISSISSQIHDLYYRLTYSNSALERSRTQSQIDSLSDELTTCYTCLDLARDKSELESQINTLELLWAQAKSDHQSKLEAIEKQYKGG